MCWKYWRIQNSVPEEQKRLRWGRHVGSSWTSILETGVSKNIKDVTQSKEHISQFYPSAPPLLVPSWSFSSSSCCCYCRAAVAVVIPLVSSFPRFVANSFPGARFSWFSSFSFRLSNASSSPYFLPCWLYAWIHMNTFWCRFIIIVRPLQVLYGFDV